MTPDQIAAVQRHFMSVYPVKAKVTETFYQRLFEIAPNVRALFPQDMTVQREKLAGTLAFVVKNLANTDHLQIAVAGLSRRHRGYGTKAAHFAPVGEALLYALDAGGPEPMSDAERDAWSAAYDMIAAAMIAELDPSDG